jgi:hypothetical protein
VKGSDERLRAAYLERPEPEEAPEVSSDDMWAVATGEIVGDDARAILERIVASPASVAAWQVTRELVAEAGLEPVYDETPEVARVAKRAKPPRRPWWPWAAWGGAALAAAVAVFLVIAPRSTAHLGGGGSTHLRSGGDAIDSALGTDPSLARDAFELRWTGAPDGSVYEVHVTTERLEPIVNAFDVAEAKYAVTADDLAGVAPGTRLLWRVVAVTSDGERIESPSFTVRVE